MTAQTGSSSLMDTPSRRALTKPTDAGSEPAHEAIAERAYALWMSAGCAAGRDMEFWCEAERQLREGFQSATLVPAEPLRR